MPKIIWWWRFGSFQDAPIKYKYLFFWEISYQRWGKTGNKWEAREMKKRVGIVEPKKSK